MSVSHVDEVHIRFLMMGHTVSPAKMSLNNATEVLILHSRMDTGARINKLIRYISAPASTRAKETRHAPMGTRVAYEQCVLRGGIKLASIPVKPVQSIFGCLQLLGYLSQRS